MFNFIQKMHGKSESKRRTFAVLVSLAVFVIIFGVWLSIHLSTSSDEIAKIKDETMTPISSLTSFSQNVAGAFGSLTGAVDNLGKELSDLKVLLEK